MKSFIALMFSMCLCLSGNLSTSDHSKAKTEMSNYINDSYDKEWKEIKELEQKGLIKSAKEKVEALYQRALSENNPAQLVKCIIYRENYNSSLNEDGYFLAIEAVKSEIARAKFPVASVLESMLGEMYNNYLNNYSYQINSRTKIGNSTPEDMRTWAAEDFVKASNLYYRKSISDKATQKVKIDDFEDIMTTPKKVEGLRTSLYDFLMHRSLDHFAKANSYLSEPVYKFYVDQKEAFGDLQKFINHDFKSQDESSQVYQSILLFQDLLAYRQNENQPSALLDANLKRLEFVNNISVHPEKDKLYKERLEALLTANETNAGYADVAFLLASYYQSAHYDNKEKKYLNKSFQICKKAIDKYPKSTGGANCHNLLLQIQRKHLTVRVEDIYLPNENLLSLIEYRNISKAYFKVIKMSVEERKRFTKVKYNNRLNFLNNLKAVQSFSLNLPNLEDFDQHSIEYKIDPLDFGMYTLLTSASPNFEFEGSQTYHVDFAVSNISYLKNDNTYGEQKLVMIHRETGAAMEKVKVDFYEDKYEDRSRKMTRSLLKTEYSDKNGFVIVPKTKNGRFTPVITFGEDVLDLERAVYARNARNEARSRQQVYFFLDRAIYRPGQKVFFKALVYNSNGKDKPSLAKNQEVEVIFKDANYQEVEKLSLRTTSFGSVQGSFTTPSTGMLGRMQIQVGSSSKSLQVEEYKRPKFEVNFDKIEGEYNLNEKVSVSGKAKALAAYPIDGASVSYRIERSYRFPYWRYYWSYRRQAPMVIKNGSTKTDAEGKFEVDFELLPDRSVSADKKPIFNYTIYADVTDNSGETRSTQTVLKAGYVSLLIDVEIKEQINLDEASSLKISGKNLNGSEEFVEGTLLIDRLNSPEKIYRKRYWNIPDNAIFSNEDFEKYFPEYSFKDSEKLSSLSIDTKFLKEEVNTKEKSSFELPKNLRAGQYRLTFKSKDKNGTDLEVVKYFTAFDKNKKVMPETKSFWHFEKGGTYEPGETVNLYMNSGLEPAHVLIEIEKQNAIVKRFWKTISGPDELTIEVNEEDRGDFYYHLTHIYSNRVERTSQRVTVPWSNKELKITYGTFRDKLLPGQEETWQIKISGPKKDKVAAEFVGAMYDASLDQFTKNEWLPSFYPNFSSRLSRSQFEGFMAKTANMISRYDNDRHKDTYKQYRMLDWFGFNWWGGNQWRGEEKVMMMEESAEMEVSSAPKAQKKKSMRSGNAGSVKETSMAMADSVGGNYAIDGDFETTSKDESKDSETGAKPPLVRTNLNETVFFFPDLHTDENGDIILKFKMNEALTKWKFLGFAHTEDLKFGLTEKEVVTQKELMVQPNAPRFFRQDDNITYSAKVINLSDKPLSGIATLTFYDALSMKPVTSLMSEAAAKVKFDIPVGASSGLAWDLKIPSDMTTALVHRVIVEAGALSDGEESALPVLPNKMLVTETMPLPVRAGENKTFVFESMKANNSSTLQHYNYSVEFTSNPAWYAVQALPYMMEYPYDCTEQIFNRMYANALASHVANAHPKVKRIFESWKGTDAMKSNLSKNQELKSALLEETPWVLDAQSEEQQKQNIGLLFDLNKMSYEFDQAVAKIKERQLSNGGFSWFPGGRDSWYITQYLVEGFGHLKALGVPIGSYGTASKNPDVQADQALDQILPAAISYIDDRFDEYFRKLKSDQKKYMSNMVIHYMYTRSFFNQIPMSAGAQKAFNHYIELAKTQWVERGLYEQGMLTLAFHRNGNADNAAGIIASLKERALQHEELGMFWKYNTGYYWYQLPIETHSLMIEVFEEVAEDAKSVDELKLWLLKNKQTNNWKTTKATSAAVYALLLSGDNWIMESKPVEVTFTNVQLNKELATSQANAEAGTGYFKHSWDTYNTEMNTIKVDNKNSVAAWGSAYWQYFEQLDKITGFEKTPLQLKKSIFKEVQTDTGAKLEALPDGEGLKVGEKLMIRIELRVDRDMEYIHMKDMRAAGLEPLNVISQYKWQGGLGYYESTKDISTNFFFDYLPKGTYVFEYPLRVFHEGDFSNGITTIQSMYAPEFTSHSEGERIKVEK